MDDCLFCKISKKEIPSEVIYEDAAALAFLDINPLTPGHTLIVPKTHAEHILELENASVGPVFLAVKNVTAKLDAALMPRGFTIGINHGKVSGQTVDHLHIHVIPRYEGDGGGSMHSVVHYSDNRSVKEVAAIVNSH
jgi:histidine triad (HIT) family protein